ncbi:MAG: RSP_7527 family protein [Geminicoccales bacterium]
MDSFYGFDAGKAADTNTFPRTKFPTTDEIDAHMREAQRLRAEVTAAGLSAAFKTLVRSLRVIGGAIGRWHERGQLRQALMSRNDRLLADIGAERDRIDAFLRGEKPDRHPVDPPFELWRIVPERIEAIRQERRERKQIENELMAYKDSELDDIGIHRADIREIARSKHRVAA